MARRKRKNRDEPKRPVGRPPAEFTPEQIARIEEMALNGCHTHTIAKLIGVDDKTLLAHFSELMTQKRAEGRAALRKAQYDGAIAGDHTMLVWLGKNRLEQTDKAQIEQTHKLKLYDKEAPVDEV